MKILTIDPGTEETGWCLFEDDRVIHSGVYANEELLLVVRGAGQLGEVDVLAIEMIASCGMAVGREVFETCVWIRRFQQAWSDRRLSRWSTAVT